MSISLGPFHRDQRRPTPLTADAYALDEAHDRKDHRAPDADRGVTRDEADREGRQAGQEQSRDQGHLAPDAVAIMSKQRRTDRARDKPDRVDAEGLQGSNQRVG
jgi:hypothetical protein